MQSKPNLSVEIPFDGFYCSIWSEEIDREEEQCVEYETEKQGDAGIPKELQLDEDEIRDVLSDCISYSDIYASAAHAIADAFNSVASEEAGFPLDMTFEEMTSPRFYNFETDRIFMSIPRASVAKLFRRARRDNFSRLRSVLRDRHTSYDGFCSFYSNDVEEWKAKPVSQWDHNELGSLLRAYAPVERNDLIDAVLYREGLFREFQEGVDWLKFEEMVAAKRAEKEEEIRALDPNYVPPAPRCPLTLDLFR